MRRGGTPAALAIAFWLIPSGMRNSSSSTSPGWMLGRAFTVVSVASVVIDGLHVMGVTIPPAEAHAPLVVDPDAVLALAATFECFKTIGGRNPQVIQGDSAVKHAQLAAGDLLNHGRQSSG